jgi:16S rRNA (uracil1498-N3)-methyltransferase
LHTLGEEESRHAVKVLRLGVGSRLHLTDGRGTLYEAEIVNPSPRGCDVRVVSSVWKFGARDYRLTMAVAPTKNGDRFEWFLEKATEVGFDAVVPILCDNSERRVFNSARAQKMLASAMKQSLKAYLPSLEPLTPVRELIGRPFEGVKLIAHCREEVDCFGQRPRNDDGASVSAAASVVSVVSVASVASVTSVAPAVIAGSGGDATKQSRIPITQALPPHTDALILIGPEGDFTAEEVALAIKNGFVPISLGDSRLRTETAALAAVVAAYFTNL